MDGIRQTDARGVLAKVDQALAEREFTLADDLLRGVSLDARFGAAPHTIRQVRQQAFGAFERCIEEDYFPGDGPGFREWTSHFGRWVAGVLAADPGLETLVPDPPPLADFDPLTLWEVWELLIARGWSTDRPLGFFEGLATLAAHALAAAGR
ncbi:MAG: hypothetical protein KC466_05730 [Myxococcales bacterium]|nr:hypothetical protein [Myxococcales bacterium]